DEKAIRALMATEASWADSLNAVEDIYAAQVRWAVRNEMARTIEDVLARRTRILFTNARVALDLGPEVAEIIRQELNLDEEWKVKQIEIFSELAKGYLLKNSNAVPNAG